MFKILAKIRVGLLHATFHRNMSRAIAARKEQNVVKFKRSVYKSEDAWRKLVIIKKKYNL